MERNRKHRVPGVSRLLSVLGATSSRASLSGAIAVSALLATMPAMAQSTTEGGIETVTVTAQYTTQNLQSAPLAISAVTSQDIEQRGINDLSGFGTSIPALTLTQAPAAFGSALQIYIRGIGQYDSAFASEPGVGTYIDDVYYGTMYGTEFDLIDLARIEVLKGPQGVLGGKNNIGGAIRLISKKPQGDNSGYLEATYGSFSMLNIKGAFDVPIIKDHLFLRVSGVSRHQKGYVNVIDYACAHPATAGSLPVLSTKKSCVLGTQGGTNVNGGRVQLRAVVNSHMEDNLSIEMIHDDSESQPDVLYAADPGDGNVYYNRNGTLQSVPRGQFVGLDSDGNPTAASGVPAWNNANIPGLPPGPIAAYGIPWDQRFVPDNPYKETYGTYTSQEGLRYTDGAQVHTWGVTNVFDWDILPNLHFKNITGYKSYHAANSNDSDVSPMSYQLTTTYGNNREFQEEGRFTGTLFDDKLEWTAGLFYYHRINHATGPVVLDANYVQGSTFLVFEQNDVYKTTNKSAYLHMIYHLFDNMEVFGGIRYTSEDKTYYFDHSGVVPGYPLGGFFRDTVDPTLNCNIFAGHICDHSINPPLVPHTSKTARPDWRGGIDYHLTDDKMVYVQYSTGYRTGGTNSRPFAPDQLDSYGPEVLKSWEIGAKTEWWNHRLRLNVALFHADYTNIITPLSQTDMSLGFPLPYVKYVNLGSATDEGFEIEATAAPFENMLIDANYSYTDLSSTALPGAPTGYINGCSAAGVAAGLCPQVAAGTVKVGSPPILFPKQTFHIDAQYVFDFGDIGSFTPRLDYSWHSTIYQDSNANPYTEVRARGILDARLTWDAAESGWEASFQVKNLTDERYFLAMSNFAIFGEGTVEAEPAPPREWMITLKKSF